MESRIPLLLLSLFAALLQMGSSALDSDYNDTTPSVNLTDMDIVSIPEPIVTMEIPGNKSSDGEDADDIVERFITIQNRHRSFEMVVKSDRFGKRELDAADNYTQYLERQKERAVFGFDNRQFVNVNQSPYTKVNRVYESHLQFHLWFYSFFFFF